MSAIRLIHLADIHLGFPGPTSLIFTASEQEEAQGRYVREVDIERAVGRMVKAIVHEQPPVDVVAIAGDLFHRPAPYPRAISRAAKLIRRLVENGIGVVIIDGNHETTSVLHTGSPTTFLKELGAYVANGNTYEIFRDCWDHLPGEKRERLKRLAIHVLPYRAVAENTEFSGVRPLPGYTNILVTHGRVSGMDDLNSLHRTAAPVPTELLRRGWDYVALGDWHIHRYQPLRDAPAFYSGSLEALTFGEAMSYPFHTDDSYAVHGALDIRLQAGTPVVVQTFANHEARPVLRLEPIDATDMDAPALMKILRQRLQEDFSTEALIQLKVNNCPPQAWEQLDFSELAELRKKALRCEILPDISWPMLVQSDETVSETKLDTQWQRFIELREQEAEECAWYRDQGMKRIEDAQTALLAEQAEIGG
jgi:DNA repair exonuclease SbcCD nuclease subunit